ncbi:MAG TPA: diacylglycerol kinase family protein [Anaerolineales bacterium]|nr:diacylglycerol kinase family protein [Anaerolineales bacterium]
MESQDAAVESSDRPRRARTRLESFRFAFAGLWYVLKTQRNAWIHALATMLVAGLALWLRLPREDWALLLLAISLVWLAEFVNTALEAVVDLASPQQHPLARVGKDVGAAAVLTAAITAAMTGLLVMGPPLWQRLFGR